MSPHVFTAFQKGHALQLIHACKQTHIFFQLRIVLWQVNKSNASFEFFCTSLPLFFLKRVWKKKHEAIRCQWVSGAYNLSEDHVKMNIEHSMKKKQCKANNSRQNPFSGIIDRIFLLNDYTDGRVCDLMFAIDISYKSEAPNMPSS